MNYQERLVEFSESELYQIANLKRLMENLIGDDEFQRLFLADDPEAGVIATSRGCDVDLSENRDPLLKFFRGEDFQGEVPPALHLWTRFSKIRAQYKADLTAIGSLGRSDRFNRWRSRQVRRAQSELGNLSRQIIHPVAAFELSVGCTVGCKFCGVSASAFGGHFSYDENAAEWQAVIAAFGERFGQAMTTSFCYWATDPLDNPDYSRFISDFRQEFGILPQTTTAIPLRNLELTRQVLALSSQYGGTPNRFSVLSKNVLRRLMSTFSAMEMLHVELVMQTPGGNVRQANAGRNFNVSGEGPGRPSTIACVTGFLVNVVQRTIKLVSPTAASETWPDGYIVLAEDTYRGAGNIGEVLDRLISQVEVEPSLHDILQFREDLSFSREGDGFALDGAVTRHLFKNLGHIAEVVNTKTLSFATLQRDLSQFAGQEGEGAAFVSALYNAGLVSTQRTASTGMEVAH